MNLLEELRERILLQLDMSDPVDDEELRKLIYQEIRSCEKQKHIPLREQMNLGKALFHSFRKLDVLEDLVEDRSITEIMVNGKDHIFIEREGALFSSGRVFSSSQKLDDVVQQIAAISNRLVNESSPIADARLADGSRVNIVLPPVALDGPVITIRKFPEHPYTMSQLIGLGSLTVEAAEFLKKLVKAKYNIFISGGTGSGKTTFLNALSEFIPRDERIITIEDNAELKLLGKQNLVRLEARNKNTEGSGEIPIRTLIRTALRMRPDRIIVGEVRQEEAIDMLQAMSTGHDGSISTGHANSPADMLTRLETMVLMGMDIPLAAVRMQIASSLDVLVHLGRMKDKSRKVIQIAEVGSFEGGRIRLNPLFTRKKGELVREGALQAVHKLELAGLDSEPA